MFISVRLSDQGPCQIGY